MNKFFKKHIDTQLIGVALAFTFIYCFMFNTSVLIHKYNNHPGSCFNAIFSLIKQFIYTYIIIFTFFLGFTIYRLVFIIGSLFLFITGAIASYYLFYFDQAPVLELMPNIYNSNINVIQEQANVKMIVWLIFSLIICMYGLKHFNPHTPKLFLSKIIATICLFLALNNIIKPYCECVESFFPLQYLHNSYVYFFDS